MANFSKEIPCKYDLKTYIGTKNTYEWICKSLKKLGINDDQIRSEFLFEIGDLTCTCVNIEEFTENAFGQKEYSLIRFSVFSFKWSNLYISISNSNCTLYVSAENKNALEKAINSLENTSIEDEVNTENTVINNNYNIGSIQGNNNNIIQGGDNSIITEKTKNKSRICKWIEAILQNLVANWIWVVVPVIIAFIAAYSSSR